MVKSKNSNPAPVKFFTFQNFERVWIPLLHRSREWYLALAASISYTLPPKISVNFLIGFTPISGVTHSDHKKAEDFHAWIHHYGIIVTGIMISTLQNGHVWLKSMFGVAFHLCMQIPQTRCPHGVTMVLHGRAEHARNALGDALGGSETTGGSKSTTMGSSAKTREYTMPTSGRSSSSPIASWGRGWLGGWMPLLPLRPPSNLLTRTMWKMFL